MTSIPSEDYFMVKVIVNPNQPSIVYALSRYSLFKSSDYGSTWVKKYAPNTLDQYCDLEFKPSDPNVLFLCTRGNLNTKTSSSLYCSHDGANSWDPVNIATHLKYGNSPDTILGMTLATTPADPNAIYVAYYRKLTNRTTLEKSVNNGTTFACLVDDKKYLDQANFAPNLTMAISPNDANKIYLGGGYIYRYNSSTSDLDWIHNNLHVDIRGIFVLGGSPETIYVGHDGGISYSQDAGNTWISMSEGLQLGMFFSVAISENNSNVLLGGLGDCGTHLFDGINWNNTCIGCDGGTTLIDNLDATKMYAECNTHYQKSPDFGYTFDYAGVSSAEYAAPMIQNPSSHRIYAASSEDWNQSIKYSDDYGSNWSYFTPIYGGDRITAMAISEFNPNIFYFSKIYYDFTQPDWPITVSILKTINNGTTWVPAKGNLGTVLNEARITGIEIHPSNPDIVWVCFGNLSAGNKVYQTTNGGSTWTNISGNLDNFPVCDIEYDEIDNLLFIATDAGVYVRDYPVIGSTWERAGNFPKAIATKITFNKKSGDLYASTFGRGIWKYPHPTCYDGTNLTITSNTTWNTCKVLCSNLIVQSGTLTLNAYLIMSPEATITVNSGATLYLNSGCIKNANITVNSGGTLRLVNNSSIFINSNDSYNIKQGAILDIPIGSIIKTN